MDRGVWQSLWGHKDQKSWTKLNDTVVKNPPANAGDQGFNPWSGKIPRAAEQLSLCTTTTEPAL